MVVEQVHSHDRVAAGTCNAELSWFEQWSFEYPGAKLLGRGSKK